MTSPPPKGRTLSRDNVILYRSVQAPFWLLSFRFDMKWCGFFPMGLFGRWECDIFTWFGGPTDHALAWILESPAVLP